MFSNIWWWLGAAVILVLLFPDFLSGLTGTA